MSEMFGDWSFDDENNIYNWGKIQNLRYDDIPWLNELSQRWFL